MDKWKAVDHPVITCQWLSLIGCPLKLKLLFNLLVHLRVRWEGWLQPYNLSMSVSSTNNTSQVLTLLSLCHLYKHHDAEMNVISLTFRSWLFCGFCSPVIFRVLKVHFMHLFPLTILVSDLTDIFFLLFFIVASAKEMDKLPRLIDCSSLWGGIQESSRPRWTVSVLSPDLHKTDLWSWVKSLPASNTPPSSLPSRNPPSQDWRV